MVDPLDEKKWLDWVTEREQLYLLGVEKTEAIVKLKESPQYPEIMRMVAARAFPTDDTRMLSGEIVRRVTRVDHAAFIYGLVNRALRGPSADERLTGGERKLMASKVIKAADDLANALRPIIGDPEQVPFEFQALFDRLSLDLSLQDGERLAKYGNPQDEETLHRMRSSIYFVLMNRLGDVLDSVKESADWWRGSETILKKPNDPNALRLYFIRVLTREFLRVFETPLRALTLSLTSVFFNCDDIDEAALSRLAPVPKPKPPIQISEEEWEHHKAIAAQAGIDLDWAMKQGELKRKKARKKSG